MRLLLVEDDEALRTVTAQRLRREGYAVDECGDGIEGMDYAINADYDGLVLDIMLPGMDGLSLLRALRARGYSGGVLLLTARDAVEDRVNGLDSGADDYLVKPFAFEELSARLRALLRKQTANRAVLLRLGDLEMDTSARTVRRGSRLISLTAKEYALLEYLIRTYTRPGETVLDNCMGSGSTGVACAHTGRRFVGMEQDEQYFAVAERRIAEAGEGLAA